jgi:hypothetical protein
MVNRNRSKGRTLICKTLHYKLIIQTHEPIKEGRTRVFREGRQLLPVVLLGLKK